MLVLFFVIFLIYLEVRNILFFYKNDKYFKKSFVLIYIYLIYRVKFFLRKGK